MKHSPTPEQLWGSESTKIGGVRYCVESGSPPQYEEITVKHLPPDLDRLFRASPKLVEALRRLLTYVGDACESSQRFHTEESCSVCNARAALKDAGLEE